MQKITNVVDGVKKIHYIGAKSQKRDGLTLCGAKLVEAQRTINGVDCEYCQDIVGYLALVAFTKSKP